MNIVSMPHAADGRLQLKTANYVIFGVSLFQCRTRQVVGCNHDGDTLFSLIGESFNAARGKWSVATTYHMLLDIGMGSFNAARGKWSVATNWASVQKGDYDEIVSMPHAASGRLQLNTQSVRFLSFRFNAARGKWSVATPSLILLKTLIFSFQCRTRQVVGCNRKKKTLKK